MILTLLAIHSTYNSVLANDAGKVVKDGLKKVGEGVGKKSSDCIKNAAGKIGEAGEKLSSKVKKEIVENVNKIMKGKGPMSEKIYKATAPYYRKMFKDAEKNIGADGKA